VTLQICSRHNGAKRRIRGFLAGAGLLACAIAASARIALGQPAGSLVAPDEILLYLHAGLKNTDFVEPLVCSLKRVLVAPVDTQSLDVALGPELLASPTQLDVAKVASRFRRATAPDGSPRTFKYFLIPYDMKDAQYRFVFATSFGNMSTPYHDGVVSMARLDVSDPNLSRHQRADMVADRAYKLILKSIARLAGFPDVQRCVLAFPRGIDELDRKSSEFCAEDRAALVEARILKSEESAGCVYVSGNTAEGSFRLDGADKTIRQPHAQ
jgi:predicted Zn-dependent protease